MSEEAKSSFPGSFVAGLVVGLVVGGVIGAVVPTFLESQPPIPAPVGGAPAGDRDREEAERLDPAPLQEEVEEQLEEGVEELGEGAPPEVPTGTETPEPGPGF